MAFGVDYGDHAHFGRIDPPLSLRNIASPREAKKNKVPTRCRDFKVFPSNRRIAPGKQKQTLTPSVWFTGAEFVLPYCIKVTPA